MGEEKTIPVHVVSQMLTKWLEKHSLNGHCLGSSNISGTSDSRCGCQLYCLCEGNLRAQPTAGRAHSKGKGRGVQKEK